VWLRMASVLRLKGTVVDFDANPHLAWLAW